MTALLLLALLVHDKPGHKPIAQCEIMHVHDYGDAWLVRCRTPKRYAYAGRAGRTKGEAEAIALEWLMEHSADWEVIDVQQLMQKGQKP